MKLRDLAKGSSVFLGVVVAGYLSTIYVDQRFATQPDTSSPASSACIGADGSWKNWSWPNVPALSPKCK
ncbi:hypothetical protein IVA79_34835 [Bradyrhizobium sp. 138]|uniref:hypothetical protein n=1 Tax=Bradyrhizobium sp. 138 TaxID=2782615 RepID=UPI001FFA1EC6|nr:hypothetical protein [Bradyrhizobium sp. 138]MCK1739009.1 hypothetical protein [Bradyrhizobium sp. 138]